MPDSKLDSIAGDLRTLSGGELRDPTSVFLEVVDTGDGREVTVRGNREGLLYLASQIVALAASAIPGKHCHFDELSVLDQCDRALVVTYSPAAWER